jgi:HlyD family secretion protein
VSRRTIFIGLGILVVALAVGGFFYLRQRATAAQAGIAALQTSTVQRGTVESAVSASGTVTALQSATINWASTGVVGHVNVQVGQQVKAGDVLMELDPKSLDNSYVQAEADLLTAQDNLNTLLAGPTAQQIAQAKLNVVTADQAVTTAQRNLTSIMNPVGQSLFDTLATAQNAFDTAQANSTLERVSADATAVQTAQNNMNQAYSNLQRAQQNYNDCTAISCAEIQSRQTALTNATNAYQSAQNTYNAAKLSYDTKVNGQGLDVTTAQQNLAQAQANLTAAQAGPDQTKVTLYQAQLDMVKANAQQAKTDLATLQAQPKPADVASAQAKLAAAQAVLDSAKLTAPFSGTIMAVASKAGDSVSSASEAVVIADISAFVLQADISEVDINSVMLGQTVDLTVDAVPDETFTGQVSAILGLGKSTQGVVTFPVTITILKPDVALKAGMTAAVSIITEQHVNVLTVPNRALRSTGGQRTVTVLFEGQQIPVPVTVGLAGDSVSEIVDDGSLREGDAVVITTTTSTGTGTGTGAGGGFGGGGFGGGAGFVRPGGG